MAPSPDASLGLLAHGGSLEAARRLFPGAPEPWLDLSTGINAVPYPLPRLPPSCFTRLPEPNDLRRLEEAAAQAYGVPDPACVVAAPGTQIIIELLPRLWPASAVTILGPTYAEHAHSWRKAGASVTERENLAALTDATCAVICNPNNPDGRRWSRNELAMVAAVLANRGCLLIVDEAFADLEGPDLSLAPLFPLPGAVVLRSFGKTYGLAGVRLGFLVASPERATAVRSALGPWAVSGPAIEAGLAALADVGWRAATAARLATSAALLDAVLTECGLAVRGGTRLFRLASAADAPDVFERLGQAGIWVRRFAARPDWLRFGVTATAGDLARLRAALA